MRLPQCGPVRAVWRVGLAGPVCSISVAPTVLHGDADRGDSLPVRDVMPGWRKALVILRSIGRHGEAGPRVALLVVLFTPFRLVRPPEK